MRSLKNEKNTLKSEKLMPKENQNSDSLRKSATIRDSAMFKFAPNSITKSTLVMEKILEERNSRFASPEDRKIFKTKRSFRSSNSKNDTIPEQSTPETLKLKKEYFKLVFCLNFTPLEHPNKGDARETD